jgi:hypothetical protein
MDMARESLDLLARGPVQTPNLRVDVLGVSVKRLRDLIHIVIVQQRMLASQAFDLNVDFPFLLLRQQPKHNDLFFIVVEPVGAVESKLKRLFEEFLRRILISDDPLRRGRKEVQRPEY